MPAGDRQIEWLEEEGVVVRGTSVSFIELVPLVRGRVMAEFTEWRSLLTRGIAVATRGVPRSRHLGALLM